MSSYAQRSTPYGIKMFDLVLHFSKETMLYYIGGMVSPRNMVVVNGNQIMLGFSV